MQRKINHVRNADKLLTEKKKNRHEESNLQIACKRWFDLRFPPLAPLLFSVPNGGLRNKVTAIIMSAEGMVAGVSDMILLVPNKTYNALCLEFKTATGQQSPKQKKWQEACTTRSRCRYVIIRSPQQFIEEIENYLRND